MTLISLILTIIQAIIAMLNGQPINEIPLGVNGEISVTLETLAGTFTATNLWFVTRTPDTPDPPPEPPAGYIGIYDIDDLQAIGNDPDYPLDGDYVLMNDIDASATATWNGGAGFAPIESFTGTLDGQGYVIDGLVINRPATRELGLIKYNYGAITNLGLENISITGLFLLGGIASANYDPGCIESCYVAGSIAGTQSLGGIVATNYAPCTITDCYSVVDVTGSGDIVGGLVGSNSGNVIRCYSAGAVVGSYEVGGLIGKNNLGTITASYYDTTTSGQADYGKGEPRTTAAMMQQATFSGWDFGVTWTIDEGVDYPRLMWE